MTFSRRRVCLKRGRALTALVYVAVGRHERGKSLAPRSRAWIFPLDAPSVFPRSRNGNKGAAQGTGRPDIKCLYSGLIHTAGTRKEERGNAIRHAILRAAVVV